LPPGGGQVWEFRRHQLRAPGHRQGRERFSLSAIC
jgi:hypothetical protein